MSILCHGFDIFGECENHYIEVTELPSEGVLGVLYVLWDGDTASLYKWTGGAFEKLKTAECADPLEYTVTTAFIYIGALKRDVQVTYPYMNSNTVSFVTATVYEGDERMMTVAFYNGEAYMSFDIEPTSHGHAEFVGIVDGKYRYLVSGTKGASFEF